MKNLFKQVAVSAIAAAVVIAGTAATAFAEITETYDLPEMSFMSDDAGIEPYSAQNLRIYDTINANDYTMLTNDKNPAEKEDDTSVYIFIGATMNGSSPVYAQVWGCRTETFSKSVNVTLNASGLETTRVIIPVGVEYVIWNHVNESDSRYAGLKLRSYTGNTQVVGYWSPDSVNTAYMPVADD